MGSPGGPSCPSRSRSCSKTCCARRWPFRQEGRHRGGRGLDRQSRQVEHEIAFRPARVLMQDFTGVPAVVDLAAMRDAMQRWAAIPKKINPLVPVDLVIDHSVQVDRFGSPDAFAENVSHRVRAQPRALRVPALGPEGVRQLPRRAARHRHLPPGKSRVSGAGGVVRAEDDGRTGRLSRHAGRHRQPHHDDQRPGRAGLGRGRHRGRGRHARPAAVHARPRSGRLRARRASCRRARRPPTWCSPSRKSCARRAWSTSSSSSSARASMR